MYQIATYALNLFSFISAIEPGDETKESIA
jgi:hypothetical protein